MFKNNPGFAASETMKTIDMGMSRVLSDPRSEKKLLKLDFNQTIQDNREFTKIPDYNTLTIKDNKSFLQPLGPP